MNTWEIKRWEVATMVVGVVALLVSAVFFGASPVNAVGVALIAFPPVLYLVRRVEAALRGATG